MDFELFVQPSRCTGLADLCQITDHLFLSNRSGANNSCQLTDCKITCIVNVSERASSCPPPGVEYIHIPVSDSPVSPLQDYFDEVADKIEQTAGRGGRTLVHCNAGVSRSATLCMAYLMKHSALTLQEAHTWVKTCRPVIRPNFGFWKQLIEYEMKIHGCKSVHMVSSSMGQIPDIYEEEAKNMVPL